MKRSRKAILAEKIAFRITHTKDDNFVRLWAREIHRLLNRGYSRDFAIEVFDEARMIAEEAEVVYELN